MAVYTMTFKEFFDAGFTIGDYPIWDESYRNVLNTKIKNHYYFKEIGQETPARFKFYLDTKLNEIMPYYNELYLTTLKKYDIDIVSQTEETYLGNVDSGSSMITENIAESESTTQGTSESADTSTSESDTDVSNVAEATNSGNTRNTGTIENKTDYNSDATTTNNDVYSLSDNRELETPEGELTLINGQLSPGYLTRATTNRTEQGGSSVAEHRGNDTATTTNNTLTAVDNNAASESLSTSNTASSSESSSTASSTASNTATAESMQNVASSAKSTNEYIKNIIVRNPNMAVNSIEKLRASIVNIDMLIIEELNELFMLVY